MPPKRGSGRGSGRGSSGSAGRSSAGRGLAHDEESVVVPALGPHADPADVAPTGKYDDTNPNGKEAVVAVNEAHMLLVNEAVDIIQEALPGGAGKES
jgi:hypothetical protein